VQYEYIEDQQQLVEFCSDVKDAPFLGFDTEFVSEDTYRPQLCLIQVAAGERLAVIDPLALDDVSPFWQLLASEGRETIVHAGREEFRFCLFATGGRPATWFDIQIAAGFTGLDYPAAYSTLISKLLGKNLPKGETRTNWRRRPLSERQLEYALHDVIYLKQIRDILSERLGELGRVEWLDDELTAWQDQIEQAERSEQWRRVSGIANLSRRQLAIVREIWRWRDAEAQRRDSPSKRVLRDDLIVELARRQTDNAQRIRAVRGMEHRHLQRDLPDIADRVRTALELPESSWPARSPRGDRSQPPLVLLGQFLNTALGSICRSAKIAPGLVGSVQDVREFVAHRLGLAKQSAPPSLTCGWRAEVVGRELDQLLDGSTVLRVTDPLADQPVSIETLPASSESRTQ
jgi:ribonuclease D